MASLKRLKKEQNNFENSKINQYYDFNLFSGGWEGCYSTKVKERSPEVYIMKNNKIKALFEIPPDYPFKPPIIYMKKSFTQVSKPITETYINWSFRNGENMNKEIKKHNIRNYDLLNIWFFIINKNYLLFRDKDINKISDFCLSSPLPCFCCSTILCSNKWSPAIKITDIVFEIIIREELFKLCKKNGLRYIYCIFHNDRWNLNEDIIWTIIDFLIKE